MNKIIQYIKESIQDFNAVTWPTRRQAIRISTIVFIFMVAGAVVLGFADQLLAEGYKMLLSLSI